MIVPNYYSTRYYTSFQAFQKVLHIGEEYPIHKTDCLCLPSNKTIAELNPGMNSPWKENDGQNATKHLYPCEFNWQFNTTDGSHTELIEGFQTVGCHYVPNAYLMSCLLFIGTFLMSWHLKKFKFGNFFTTTYVVLNSLAVQWELGRGVFFRPISELFMCRRHSIYSHICHMFM